MKLNLKEKISMDSLGRRLVHTVSSINDNFQANYTIKLSSQRSIKRCRIKLLTLKHWKLSVTIMSLELKQISHFSSLVHKKHTKPIKSLKTIKNQKFQFPLTLQRVVSWSWWSVSADISRFTTRNWPASYKLNYIVSHEIYRKSMKRNWNALAMAMETFPIYLTESLTFRHKQAATLRFGMSNFFSHRSDSKIHRC